MEVDDQGQDTAVSFDLRGIGVPGPAKRYAVTHDALVAYADATDDLPGGTVFAIVPVWETIAPASLSVASVEARGRVVHYEHEIVAHRPIEVGMTLTSRATPTSILSRPNGTMLVIKTETRVDDGALVNEQYVTEFFRGVETQSTVGERAPDHRLDVNGAAPIAEITYPLAADQSARYAAASGDHFAIHLDDDFARGVGLPGRIVHGLCTLAFAGRAVREAAGVDDPGALRRLAVRFSAPLFPDDSVTTRIWEVDGGYGFEATDRAGVPVLKDGRAEFR
jgi:acyl dehydratase